MIRAGLRAVIFVTAMCFATVAPAQSDVPNGAKESGVFIDLQASAGERSRAADALMRKARRRGQVRVIVGLRMVLRSEDTLTEAQAAQQTLDLRSTQAAVAARARVAPDDVTGFDYIPFVSLWVDAEQLELLLADPNVVNIQEDVPGTVGLQKSVPYINAPKLWRSGANGNGWTIAILDTGVDKNHPMLRRRVVSEACYSTHKPQQNLRSFCPNNASQSVRPGSGKPCPANVNSCWHGTHVAATAAGARGKRRGVARAADIIAIQVFTRSGNTENTTFDTDWIKGLERVFKLRRKFKIGAVNMSLGFGNFTSICDAKNLAATAIIRKLRNARIPTVVAAMNDQKDGSTRSPACISEVITVGATGRTSDNIAGFSNHAPWVRHMAPGVDINSAMPGGKYGNSSGTSMASPHVAGAYTLLRDLRPSATVDDIAAALECTGAATQRGDLFKNRIDLAQARRYLLKPPRKKQRYTFNNGTAPGWIARSGGWNATNDGFLHVTEGSGGYKIATVEHCNESMNIDARLVRIWNPQGGISGVVFKAQFAGPRMSGYLAGYNRNGSFIVLRFDNYNLVADSGPFAQLCSKSVNVSNNQFNVIRVVSRGGTHRIFFNGSNKPICTVKDRSYGTGHAGILAFFQGNGGEGFAADHFNILPKEKVPRARNAAPGTAEDDEGLDAGEDDEVVSAFGAPFVESRGEPAGNIGAGQTPVLSPAGLSVGR